MSDDLNEIRLDGGGEPSVIERGKFVMKATATQGTVATNLSILSGATFMPTGTVTATAQPFFVDYPAITGTTTGSSFGGAITGGTIGISRPATESNAVVVFYEFRGIA